MPQPWERFRVGTPSNRLNWTNADCQPLTSISHVAHVHTSYRVIEDETLRADLVYDKSKLNTKRIRVVWLSPNNWSNGFRYGNIRFEFPWQEITKGRRYFWVESIDYSPPACRILVSHNDWSDTLQEYDPAVGDGPWWVDSNGNHYWNGEYCLEVMVDEDIELQLASGLSFVDHHPQYCNINPQSCRHLGLSRQEAGAEFLASVLSKNSRLRLPALIHNDSAGRARMDLTVSAALNTILRACSRLPTQGPRVESDDSVAPALGRAILSTLLDGQAEDAKALARLFDSTDSLLKVITDVLCTAMGSTTEAIWRAELSSEWS